MQGRPGRISLKIHPQFVTDLTSFAVENQWHANNAGKLHPHTSFAAACLVAHAASLPRKQRQEMLLDGARRVFEHEKKHKVEGRERVRLYRAEGVRPAGISTRS